MDTIWIEGPFVGALSQKVFGNLSELKSIYLYGENLKTLPESCGQLQGLTYLNIGCGLNSLPTSFANLTNLLEINLQQNNLSRLPDNFGNLKAGKVDLSRNKFSVFPEPLVNLKNVTSIILDDNDIKVLPESVLNLLKFAQVSSSIGLGS